MIRPPKIVLACALVACGFGALAAGLSRHGRALRVFGVLASGEGLEGSRSAEAGTLLSTGAPNVVFWAWERPDDLRFLAPGAAGVAFLAKTIYLKAARNGATGTGEASFSVRPRLQPLRITPGTPLTAVVRIENPSGSIPWESGERKSEHRAISYSPSQRDRLAEEIAELQAIPGVSAIQIDFDAPASAHSFYASLLEQVRAKLPGSFPLSITALASWCIGDRWLNKLPPGTIDEAVPMLFRMGPEAADVTRFLHSGVEFPVASCRSSLGVSRDEPLLRELLQGKPLAGPAGAGDRKIYVFSPHSWELSSTELILKELGR